MCWRKVRGHLKAGIFGVYRLRVVERAISILKPRGRVFPSRKRTIQLLGYNVKKNFYLNAIARGLDVSLDDMVVAQLY
jgi:hypothetical protein